MPLSVFLTLRVGVTFCERKEKNHEEQICNSTEQFLILKTLTAITCSKVPHQLRDLGEKKKCQFLSLSLDS